ncbi:Glutamate 5-kinase [Raoultella planticola]|uniref:Glutamate 5-kinase n=1 Tax=Raoultella planticola TaxID=575 RepID=A0A485B4B3_RAOPL|nr:Glutamate 5-kinase [Raoultella planticola]
MSTALMMPCAPSPAIAFPAWAPAVWETKLQAADVRLSCPVSTLIIAAGNRPGVIADVMESVSVGTRFHAQESPLENRKTLDLRCPAGG